MSSLSFSMPYAANRDESEELIPISVTVRNASDPEIFSDELLVTMPEHYFYRPSWSFIHNFMNRNGLFRQLPDGAIQNSESDCYAIDNQLTYVISF